MLQYCRAPQDQKVWQDNMERGEIRGSRDPPAPLDHLALEDLRLHLAVKDHVDLREPLDLV